MTECYAVVKSYYWEGVDVKEVYVDRGTATRRAEELNGVPYDPDDVQDYRVYTYPFHCNLRACLANP